MPIKNFIVIKRAKPMNHILLKQLKFLNRNKFHSALSWGKKSFFLSRFEIYPKMIMDILSICVHKTKENSGMIFLLVSLLFLGKFYLACYYEICSKMLIKSLIAFPRALSFH